MKPYAQRVLASAHREAARLDGAMTIGCRAKSRCRPRSSGFMPSVRNDGGISCRGTADSDREEINVSFRALVGATHSQAQPSSDASCCSFIERH